MVNRFSRWHKIMALMLLGACVSAGAAPPQRVNPYRADRPTLALGEPLTLRITRAVDAAGSPLGALDLSPLTRDFEIQGRTLGRDSQQEDLVLTLYPRRVGRIELPALGQPGRAPVVTVTETSATMPRVRFRVSADPAEPLVRQATTLTLEACDDGSLLWQRPLLPTVEGLLLRPINETEIITQRDGQRCTAHRWHWALLPAAAGRMTLPLPMLEAGKFGTRLRIEPPPFELRALPLPPWLPAEAAVGTPEIVVEPLPAQAVIDRPIAWRLRVTGSYSATALQTLLALQIRPADKLAAMSAYAPRVELLAGMTVAPQHLVTLYLLPRARGPWAVPDLQLPWYDPQTGQLRQARVPGGRIDVIDPVRQRWLAGLTAAAALAILSMTGAWLWRSQAWRLRRRQFLRKLKQVRSTDELTRRLLSFAMPLRESPSPTLQTWRRRVDAQFLSTGLAELVETIERKRFGTMPVNQSLPAPIDSLVLKTRAWLASLKPRRNLA